MSTVLLDTMIDQALAQHAAWVATETERRRAQRAAEQAQAIEALRAQIAATFGADLAALLCARVELLADGKTPAAYFAYQEYTWRLWGGVAVDGYRAWSLCVDRPVAGRTEQSVNFYTDIPADAAEPDAVRAMNAHSLLLEIAELAGHEVPEVPSLD